MSCTICNGTGETSTAIEGVGKMRVPCVCRGGHAEAAAPSNCDHSELTPGFAAGSFYCKKCPAKVRKNFDGTIEIQF